MSLNCLLCGITGMHQSTQRATRCVNVCTASVKHTRIHTKCSFSKNVILLTSKSWKVTSKYKQYSRYEDSGTHQLNHMRKKDFRAERVTVAEQYKTRQESTATHTYLDPRLWRSSMLNSLLSAALALSAV